MRISTKGQVTIPVDIRTRLGFLPDTEVSFINHKDGVLIKKQQSNKSRGPNLVDKLAGKSTAKMSTDAIMKLTRS